MSTITTTIIVVSLRACSVLALLPGFLVSGKIQGSVKTARDFARQQDELIKDLVAVDAWGKGEDKGARCVCTVPGTRGGVRAGEASYIVCILMPEVSQRASALVDIVFRVEVL